MPDIPATADELARRDQIQRALGEGFALGGLLGVGGFAEVYAAEDRRLKRPVAIKVLRPDVASPALAERFRREAEAAAQLRHPHIVPIYAVGEGAGIAWIVMPLIEGESLRARLDRDGALPVAEAWRILREVAGALAAAHRRGIVHRDIKPDNILLDGEEARALVTDFGIAKAMGGVEAGLTGTGMVIGTAQYMSPEQASGERAIDHRSDQYALATVAYQMLTGHVPFDGDSFQTIVYRQVAELPVPIQEANPAVPEPLARAITRALAKPAASRYASSEEFVRALDDARPAESPVAGAASPTLNVADRVRPRMHLALGGAGVVLLAGYLAAYGRIQPWGAPRASVSRNEALATARTFLVRQGATGYYRDATTIEQSDSLLRLLHFALGPTRGAPWSDSVLAVRRWHTKWLRFGAPEKWEAKVGTNGTIVSFAHTPADTTPGPPPPDATRPRDRAAAEAFLEDLGWTVALLEPVADSAGVAARGRRVYIWRVPGDSVAWPGAAAAQRQLRLEVANGTVNRYQDYLTAPNGYRDAWQSRSDVVNRLQDVSMLAFFTIPLILAVVRLARGGGQLLRWRPVTNVVAACAVLVGVNALLGWPTLLHEIGTGGGPGELLMTFLSGLLPAAILIPVCVLIAAAADDEGRALFPGCDAGLLELGQGRWRTPAVARAWLAGYGVAGFMALGSALQIVLATGHAGTWPDGSAELNGEMFNTLLPLAPLTIGIPAGCATAFIGLALAAALYRLTRRRLWLTIVLGWLLVSAMGIAGLDAWWPNALLAAVITATFVACLVWFGLLALVFGAVVYTAVLGAADLLGSGSAGYASAGVAMLVLGTAPAVLGILAQRRPAASALRTG